MRGDNCSLRNCNTKAIGYVSNSRMGLNVCKKHFEGYKDFPYVVIYGKTKEEDKIFRYGKETNR